LVMIRSTPALHVSHTWSIAVALLPLYHRRCETSHVGTSKAYPVH